MRTAALALVATLALAASAAAQPYSPPAKGSGVSFRAYAAVDEDVMAAADSFNALFGSARVTAAGGGAEVGIGEHLFVRVAVTRAKRSGSRVFVDNNDVFPLNIPLAVTMTPVEAGAGWRLAAHGRVTPYVGASFVSLGYQEVSDFAEPGDNVNTRYTGAEAFGGVDVTIAKSVFVGGEAQYRHIGVPVAPGTVMEAFGERDLGGFTLRLRIGVSIK